MEDMKNWKLWSGIALVFLAGIAIGSAGTGLYIKHRLSGLLQEGPSGIKRITVRKLTDELDLTKKQQAEIEKIVAEAQSGFQRLRAQNQPEIEGIIRESIMRMKAHLLPEQQKKLDELHERVKKHWRIPGK